MLGTSVHAPFPRWVEYVRKHYMEVDRDNNLVWFALYYDPIEQRAETFPHKVTAYSALTVLLYLYPQDRAFAEQLYTLSMRLLAWSDPRRPVVQLVDHPLNLATALFMARELGDSTTEARLREIAETKFEPRFFGAENDRFAFWLGVDSEWPRGQVNSILMLSECSAHCAGAWQRSSPSTACQTPPTPSSPSTIRSSPGGMSVRATRSGSRPMLTNITFASRSDPVRRRSKADRIFQRNLRTYGTAGLLVSIR